MPAAGCHSTSFGTLNFAGHVAVVEHDGTRLAVAAAVAAAVVVVAVVAVAAVVAVVVAAVAGQSYWS